MLTGTVANKSTCYALVRDLFFLVVYSTPTSVKAVHSYTKTAGELIGGIHIKRETAPPLVNSVTRQFSHVSQSVVTGRLVLDCTLPYHPPLTLSSELVSQCTTGCVRIKYCSSNFLNIFSHLSVLIFFDVIHNFSSITFCD